MEFLKVIFDLNDGLLDSCHCHVKMQTVNNNNDTVWLFDVNAGLVYRDAEASLYQLDIDWIGQQATLLGQGLL